MSVRLVLSLPLPPSDNAAFDYVPGRGKIRSDDNLEFRAKLAAQFRRSPQLPIFGPVMIHRLHVFFARRGCDLFNPFKVFFDGLNGFAWLDDVEIDGADQVRRFVDGANPRVEIEISGERFATKEEARAAADAKREANRKRKVSAAKTRRTKNAKKLQTMLERRLSRATFAPRSSGG